MCKSHLTMFGLERKTAEWSPESRLRVTFVVFPVFVWSRSFKLLDCRVKESNSCFTAVSLLPSDAECANQWMSASRRSGGTRKKTWRAMQKTIAVTKQRRGRSVRQTRSGSARSVVIAPRARSSQCDSAIGESSGSSQVHSSDWYSYIELWENFSNKTFLIWVEPLIRSMHCALVYCWTTSVCLQLHIRMAYVLFFYTKYSNASPRTYIVTCLQCTSEKRCIHNCTIVQLWIIAYI